MVIPAAIPPSVANARTAARFKLIFFAPTSAVPACKTAIFAAGAGRYPGPGQYTEVCWTSLGTGQFRPGDTAKPAIGTPGVLEEVEEVRVETLCVGVDVVKKAVDALKTYASRSCLHLSLLQIHLPPRGQDRR